MKETCALCGKGILISDVMLLVADDERIFCAQCGCRRYDHGRGMARYDHGRRPENDMNPIKDGSDDI